MQLFFGWSVVASSSVPRRLRFPSWELLLRPSVVYLLHGPWLVQYLEIMFLSPWETLGCRQVSNWQPSPSSVGVASLSHILWQQEANLIVWLPLNAGLYTEPGLLRLKVTYLTPLPVSSGGRRNHSTVTTKFSFSFHTFAPSGCGASFPSGPLKVLQKGSAAPWQELLFLCVCRLLSGYSQNILSHTLQLRTGSQFRLQEKGNDKNAFDQSMLIPEPGIRSSPRPHGHGHSGERWGMAKFRRQVLNDIC